MLIKRVCLYFNTLKYLKLKQLWFRFIRSVFPLKFFFCALRQPPTTRKFQRKWHQIIFYSPSIINEKPLTFSFLNCKRIIKNQNDWNAPSAEKLWLYNLHYHSFLLSETSFSLKQKVLAQWIHQNPWPLGIAWEPYPLSLRIVNWIKYFLFENQEIKDSFKKNLFIQCCSLEKQIEYHLLGNHLFENAKALLFAGLYFNTKESKRWLKKALAILHKELNEQILQDGGHFERSPMYHSIVLEGILDIYQIISLSPHNVDFNSQTSLKKLENKITQIIPEMLRWLSSLCHHDGKISFFNDSTFNIASNLQDLSQYASFLGFPLPIHKNQFLHFKESGYARAENNDALILADIGSVGPSYIPGHAHAETLSFELSLRGERLFVNSGISTYTPSKERAYQRGTLSHNTISIEGKNSSQVWSSFRVAKRAKVFAIQSIAQNSNINFSASHDGYKHSKYKLIHNREWSLLEKRIIIKDLLYGKGNPNVKSSFHLHPNWKIVSQVRNIVGLQSLKSKHSVELTFSKDVEIRIEPYDYACGFNKKIKSFCLRICSPALFLPYSLKLEIDW